MALATMVWADDTVRVVGNRVNLRARPHLQSEVVGQVNRGDELKVLNRSEGWVAVSPPDGIDFWVHRDFVDNDEVAAPRLNVRAGPGVNYNVVVTLERGTRIERRGAFAEWVRIEPPAGALLWISDELVEPVRPQPVPVPAPRPEPVPRPVEPPVQTPAPPVAPPPTEPTPVVERPAPPPPRDLDLIPLEGQGEEVQREGVLRPAGFVFGRPSRYRLTRTRGHIIETICYVRGNDAQMQSLLGHAVIINGREYWVQGARYPVLVPDQITLKPDAL